MLEAFCDSAKATLKAGCGDSVSRLINYFLQNGYGGHSSDQTLAEGNGAVAANL